jgi:hypothetical protein
MSTDIERLSAQRDEIYDWACDLFQSLIAQGRNDDALALADEFFEWLDPEQMEEETIHYYDERELIKLHYELYQQRNA